VAGDRKGGEVAVYERDRIRTDGLQGYRLGIDADGRVGDIEAIFGRPSWGGELLDLGRHTRSR